jgi:hypothetical protein
MKSKLITTLVILFLIIVTGTICASERKTIPPGEFGPLYGDWFVNDEWAAFIFYRPPGCVPDDFDFFVFEDFRAFFCVPITVEGFAIYKNPDDFIPKQGKFHGLGAVPVWFVDRQDYNRIVNDGNLTMGEVRGNSLNRGFAHFYQETFHAIGPHPTPMKNLVARGTLDEDSPMDASFQVHGLVVIPPGDLPKFNVNITFKVNKD